MPLLVLRLSSPAVLDDDGYDLRAEWLVLEDTGSVRGEGSTDYHGLMDLADPNQDWVTQPGNVLVLVPNQHVLEVSATVPGRSAGQIRRALPYAVEEFIATDIERMHLASGAIRPGQPVPCQLIERELIEGWVQALHSAGVVPGYFVADAHVLPYADDSATVLQDDNEALIHTHGQAATIDRGNLLVALQSLPIEHARLINGELTDIEAAQLQDVAVESENTGGSAVEVLARHWQGRTDINLLQGEFAPPRARVGFSKGWGIAAALACVWVLVAWGAMVAEAWWANSQAEALNDEAQTLYSSLFPGEKPRNVRRALAARIGERTASDGRGLVALTGDIAEVLPDDAGMRSLEFSGQRGELKTEILVTGFAQLEAVEKQLAERGVAAELQNSLQEDNRVRAYFLVREQR